jgi:hypothetical protein
VQLYMAVPEADTFTSQLSGADEYVAFVSWADNDTDRYTLKLFGQTFQRETYVLHTIWPCLSFCRAMNS